MPELARYPVTPEIQYFFDAEREAGEFDSASRLALMLYGDRAAISERYERDRSNWHDRVILCNDFIAMAQPIIDELPAERRGALIFTSVSDLMFRIRKTASFMADMAIGDMVEGGYMEPYLWQQGLPRRLDRHARVWRHTAARLRSPKWIRRYVKRMREAGIMRDVAKATMARVVMVPQGACREDWAIINADLTAMQERARIDGHADLLRNSEGIAFRRRLVELGWHPETADADVLVKLKSGMRRKLREERTQRRKVIRRSALACAALIGATAVSALARGEPVLLPGPTVALEVRCNGLASKGHGAVRVDVKTLDGQLLAGLCTYVEDTPALDQVAAFALFMQAGAEAEVLAKANVTHTEPAAREHPLFAGRYRPSDVPGDGRIPRCVQEFVANRNPYEESRSRAETYWFDTSAIWLEATAVFVLGAGMAKTVVPKLLEGAFDE